MMASFLMTQLKSPTTGLAGGGTGKPGRLVINGEQVDPTLPRVLKAARSHIDGNGRRRRLWPRRHIARQNAGVI